MDSMEQVLAQGKDASDVRRIPDVTREETSLAQDEVSLGGSVGFASFILLDSVKFWWRKKRKFEKGAGSSEDQMPFEGIQGVERCHSSCKGMRRRYM